jgi:alpha-N-arabinofuranosidase
MTKSQILPALLMAFFMLSARAAELHVAKTGDDSNPGTSESPFLTIQRAADAAQPGDVITVHEGIYRERVNPPRGGESETKRIVYQSAPGEEVTIKGSEVVTGWDKVGGDTWKVTVPNSLFGEFNPYTNFITGSWFNDNKRRHHPGAVYLNGEWLAEAATRDEVLAPAGEQGLWFAEVDGPNTTILAQFTGVDPNDETTEINVRQTVFYPEEPGRNFITVRGFTLRDAATPWSPPNAEQIGLIGVNWSKGWVIEDNVISHSACVGVTLGKYGDEFDNVINRRKGGSVGYNETIQRALAHSLPWTKENIGHHIVRNNTISHCEQAGIVGSLGCAFSTITGNTIHNIHVRRLFTGAEMAGIKFHGAIDTVISRNHIYRTNRGIWLDWMTQGTRVTGNLLHDNSGTEYLQDWEAGGFGGNQDIFVEVNHGPFLIDNNILLSPYAVNMRSQGGAYVHNLFAGAWRVVEADFRETPFHLPHSTKIVGLSQVKLGDDRIFNNIFAMRGDLRNYNKAQQPVWMDGNVFLGAAKPSAKEKDPLLVPGFAAEPKLMEKDGAFYLEMPFDMAWGESKERQLVTTALLGKAVVPDAAFENPDGSPLRVDTDYFGNKRDPNNPFPGPFTRQAAAKAMIKVWPIGR